MMWMIFWGCGMGLQTMDKIADTASGDVLPAEPTDEPSEEPSGEPSAQPSNEPDPLQVDDDGDGLSEAQGDCNDANPNISPNEPEIPYDGINNDCDPDTLDDDLDQDGFIRVTDCDDLDPTVHPNALDNTCDGIDDNCDGEEDEESQPDSHEPFDTLTPIHIGSLNNKNDSVFLEGYIFPFDDEDSIQFWFLDDFDLGFTEPDHFSCDVFAPSDSGLQIELYWQQDGTSSFVLFESQTINAGSSAFFENRQSVGSEDGGTFQFNIYATGTPSCMESYTISCIKDDD